MYTWELFSALQKIENIQKDVMAQQQRESSDDHTSIQVAVRVRPMNEKEERGNVLPIVNASEERREVTIVRGAGNRAQKFSYSFDHVFTGYTTQCEVFQPIESMIDSVMQGFEATVRAPDTAPPQADHLALQSRSLARHAGVRLRPDGHR